jgi:hypothetical protein
MNALSLYLGSFLQNEPGKIMISFMLLHFSFIFEQWSLNRFSWTTRIFGGSSIMARLLKVFTVSGTSGTSGTSGEALYALYALVLLMQSSLPSQ